MGGRALIVVLALWSAGTGVYVARFNPNKPLSELFGRDRLGLLSLNGPVSIYEALLREIEQELGPTSAVGVYGDRGLLQGAYKEQLEYPFFGARFSRTVVPLVAPGYTERRQLGWPLAWSSEDLLTAHRPAYIVVDSSRPGAEVLPDIVPGRCFEVPLRANEPVGDWELWRCRDDDPRSVLENGDFRAWPEPGGARFIAPSLGMGAMNRAPAELPLGWAAEVIGEGRLAVSRPDAEAGSEPFRVRLDYRAGGDPDGEGGIVQEASVGTLRGRDLVVDARVWADRERAAFLLIDDGVSATEVANRSAGAETLRLVHRVGPRATGLRIGLAVRAADRDAVVLVRTILAIPR